MPRVSRDVEIDRPIDEVFEKLNDAEFAPEWSGTVESAHTEGETEVGQTFTIEGGFLRVNVEMECEVTEHDPPHRYAYRAEEPLSLSLESDLEEAGGGTRLEMTIDLDPGRLFSLAGPLFKRQVGKQLEKDLRRFKSILEDPERA
jgi:carbon monoxide dehydrogenase subunit G